VVIWHADVLPETNQEIVNASAQDLGSSRYASARNQRMRPPLAASGRTAGGVAIESGRRQSKSAGADVHDLVRLRPECWLEREAQAGD